MQKYINYSLHYFEFTSLCNICIIFIWSIACKLLSGRVGPVVAHLTADRELLVQILSWSIVNFCGYKKWISEAPLDQGVNWYPEREVSVFDFLGQHMLAAHKLEMK